MYFFVSFTFFFWLSLYGFSRLWLRHLKEQSKRKRKLTQKFGALALYRSKSFYYWYYRERLKNSIFYYFHFNFFFQTNESVLQNKDFVTRTVKELLKFGRIKDTRGPLHWKFFYCHQKQSQQNKTYLGFGTR